MAEDSDTKSKTDPGQEKPEKARKLLGMEPVETKHSLQLKDQTLDYRAHAGALPLVDEQGETRAEIFFTSYSLTGDHDRATRPLTFVFNGGPGSSSVWLHLGALGPKRVVMQSEGWMPAPPYRLTVNEHTWLDQTDLVFVDPVGTGFSRAAKEELDQEFWNFKGDIESVGEFIRLYLTRFERWTSPLFMAGESYGTTRVAGLADHLVERGVGFSGIILISTALNLRPIFFTEGDDLPFQLFVPTYAATAWYHRMLDDEYQHKALPDFLGEVEAWAESTLTVALMKGDRLPTEERDALASQLARYTGLDEAYVQGTDLRIDIFRFCKELLREERRSVGRLDSRFKGIEAIEVTEKPEFDPSLLAIKPPYTATLNQYLRSELGIQTDLTYETLNERVSEKWEWEKGQLPNTGDALRSALAKNPFMNVFIGQGYYDLATPHFATDYMVSHMNLDPQIRENVRTAYYESGHMFYLDMEALAAFRKDVRSFLADGL